MDAKSNEITAIPKLLEILDLQGAIVTIDALGCQKDIAAQIRDAGADYVLQLKGNHETLHQAVQEAFLDHLDSDGVAVPLTVSGGEAEAGHGRVEKRTVYALAVPEGLPGRQDWRDLRTLVLVFRERTAGGKTSEAFSYYLSSREADAAEFGRIIRLHWGIEVPQSDDCASAGLCATGRAGYHRRCNAADAGRVVCPAPRARRPIMPSDELLLAPPRP